MATELLVVERIEDGGRLAAELVRSGFDVAAAFWIHRQEDGLWFLYFASSSVSRDGLGNAYGTVYATLNRLKLPGIEFVQIKLVPPTGPIALEAIAISNRYVSPIVTRLGARRLGNVAVEEAYVYPPISRALTRIEVIRAVTSRLGQPGNPPASITLRDGSTLLASTAGLQSSPSGDVTITLRDPMTGQTREVSADEITAIQ